MAYNPLLAGNDAGPELLNKANPMFKELYEKAEALGESINSFAPHLSELVTGASGVHGLKIETGTWTPILKSDNGTSAHAYSKQYGKYIKENKKITLFFHVILSAKDTGMIGNIVVVEGVPFVPDSDTNYWGALEISNIDFTNIYSTSCVMRATNNIQLNKIQQNGARASIFSSEITNTTQVYGQIAYFTN